ncbi:hypothetical protein O181_073412 [Austropuccinia psidii MF-1]|uniref:Thymidylate kinase n=1 Tax=Austropuccinia psidii MF-1 TaxID=1389203 RepID=A0A9Q3IB09_9BASI|nr:hypothetical protein [Austropuccinia psidii MF-1]
MASHLPDCLNLVFGGKLNFFVKNTRGSPKIPETLRPQATMPPHDNTLGSASCQNKIPRGPFIVFEGLDRAGKSTQCKLLSQRLAHPKNILLTGREIQSMRFPDRTTGIGKMIDSYLSQTADLDDHAIHLLFSANRWEKSSSILSAINSGKIVICDRYAFSGIAFTSAKLNIREPPEPDPIINLSSPDRGLPLPDLVIFLTLPNPDSLKDRAGFGQERYENEKLQAEVRRQFNESVRPFFEEIHGSGRWIEIDGSGSIEEVEQRIWECLQQFLTKTFTPIQSIGKLWVA